MNSIWIHFEIEKYTFDAISLGGQWNTTLSNEICFKQFLLSINLDLDLDEKWFWLVGSSECTNLYSSHTSFNVNVSLIKSETVE